ncbi:hypothetical protein NIES4101_55200 [Calothrix sp. NIES-4101]|nr:hypothetical protein NIES4101_55200 [Calothrix sp. NIES-4101]
MSGIIQTISNFFIRVFAFFSVVFKLVANSIKNFFGFFASRFGLTQTDYFLETDEAQTMKRSEAKERIENKQDTTSSYSATTNRRKKAKIDDYFLNMAREVKKT